MTDYLKRWPEDTASKKNDLIAQCDYALALVTVATENNKNNSFVSDALNILQQQLNEIDKTISYLVAKLDGRGHVPLWVMDALKLRGKRLQNVVDLMESNHNAIEFIKTHDPASNKKALAQMKANIKEMIFTLQGKRWISNAKPPKE